MFVQCFRQIRGVVRAPGGHRPHHKHFLQQRTCGRVAFRCQGNHSTFYHHLNKFETVFFIISAYGEGKASSMRLFY